MARRCPDPSAPPPLPPDPDAAPGCDGDDSTAAAVTVVPTLACLLTCLDRVGSVKRSRRTKQLPMRNRTQTKARRRSQRKAEVCRNPDGPNPPTPNPLNDRHPPRSLPVLEPWLLLLLLAPAVDPKPSEGAGESTTMMHHLLPACLLSYPILSKPRNTVEGDLSSPRNTVGTIIIDMNRTRKGGSNFSPRQNGGHHFGWERREIPTY